MKNKLVKRNMTKFDYKARKLGILGCVLAVVSLAIILPISASISKENVTLNNQIQELTNESDDTLIIIESK